MKLPKRIKSTLFTIFSLKYLIHVSSLSTNVHILKNFARAFAARISDKFDIFHKKSGILGEYLYVSHTLFILYLESSHTLFGKKLNFIWKFSSGNTGRGGGISCLGVTQDI